jgi:hypothetical protein
MHLTLSSGVLLEKLIVAQLAFNGNRKFTAVFRKAHRWIYN